MELQVAKVFTEEILHTGCWLFYGDNGRLKRLGDFENYIYETEVDGETRILRFVHSSHRSQEHKKAEVDWVEYLHRNGAPVYQHYSSINQAHIETLKAADGTEFFISCFEKLPGNRISWKDIEKNPHIAYIWGKSLGMLNRLSKNYNNGGRSVRPQWDEEELFDIERFKPGIEQDTLNYRNEILVQIRSFPKNQETYGLIHSDLHNGNFLFHQGRIH
ncbi:Ser/Thr protein kinase RdoA (MazF antagonist) [Peribacillus deserti]|uniref:Ser/Thr protein kinase RdoA (MazF antagonist) n=1 Tax=Peribacillus deserti TaxID=673318 RepID=A0ABS2QJU7_9BACI|nr:phosphotransferase [Peribacillus deserti]MBM7693372.1 Ser/Thr protein kinase RdoA (MazF antagonist) [Peribacillus deserti]